MVIKRLHLELSTNCNLKCPFCLHRTSGNYSIDFDSLCSNVLNKEYLYETRCIDLIGAYGDSIFHPRFMEIAERIVQETSEECLIQIATNGNAHDGYWWRNLAILLEGRGYVVFTLDGLKGSHELHRNSDFDTVYGNMSEFISSGGKAVWKFIVFEHNQHQIGIARQKAIDLGAEFHIQMSREYNTILRTPTIDVREAKTNDNKSCSFLEDSYYVGADGIVSPCCLYSTFDRIPTLFDSFTSKQKIAFLKNLKYLNIADNNIKEIVSSDYFKQIRSSLGSFEICKNNCSFMEFE